MAGKLDRLIERAEELHEQISRDIDEGKPKTSIDLMQVRQRLSRRDELLRAGKHHSVEGIAASAAVRRELNELQAAAEKLNTLYERRKPQSSESAGSDDIQPAVNDEIREVEDLLKNVEACIAQEKSRIGNSAEESRARLQKTMANRLDLGTLKTTGNGGGKPVAPELKEALLEIDEKEEEMTSSLDAIASGLQRIKGIAIDINDEVNVQNVMMDEIIAKSDAAKENLQGLNQKMGNVLRNAGGASSVLINCILLVILLSLGLYIYETVREGTRP